MKFIVALVLVVIFMAIRDLLGTALTIYESRGDGERAGRMDALGDVANMMYTIVGLDALNKAGFSLQGVIMLTAIAFTSYNTTKWATNHIYKRR